jgi:TIR domain
MTAMASKVVDNQREISLDKGKECNRIPLATEIQARGVVMDRRATIFLAHSTADIADARLIRNIFEKLDHDVLLLKLSQQMTESYLGDLLQREIQARDWLVVITSSNSRQSNWVAFEESYAREHRKPVFRVDVERCRSLSGNEVERCLEEQVTTISREIRVFLSYSHIHDMDMARRLKDDLEMRGYEVWLDIERLEGGSVWAKQIHNAIDRTLEKGALVVLLSADSVASKATMGEVEYALGRKGRVIPCLIKTRPARIPLALQQIQWVDFTKSYEKGFDQLLESLGSGVRTER